jgi:hypothetical protein
MASGSAAIRLSPLLPASRAVVGRNDLPSETAGLLSELGAPVGLDQGERAEPSQQTTASTTAPLPPWISATPAPSSTPNPSRSLPAPPSTSGPGATVGSRPASPPKVRVTRVAAKRRSYRPFSLKWPWLFALGIVELGVIGSLAGLAIYSDRHDGIANINAASVSSFSDFSLTWSWAYGLLWTTVPTFLVKLFELMWTSVVEATAKRQPYVDLCCSTPVEAKNARQTILLDYGTHIPLVRWIVAFRNKHMLVCVSVMLSLAVSLFLVPLTAQLLSAQASISTSAVSIAATGQFIDAYSGARNPSLRPAIDLAIAIRAYGATAPAWTTPDYAFVPFSILGADGLPAGVSGNLTTANATAYKGTLDCVSISDYNANLVGVEHGDWELELNATDRGCPISFQTTVTDFANESTSPSYLLGQSWSVPSCPGSASRRIGLVAGQWSSSTTRLNNMSYVSCIPRYSQESGSLTVALSGNTNDTSMKPRFIDFHSHQSRELSTAKAILFEDTLVTYNVFDPSAGILGDDWGTAVLETTLTRSPPDAGVSAQLEPGAIVQATADVFATIFASAISLYYLQPLDTGPTGSDGQQQQQQAATLTVPVIRLYVIGPVAWTLAGLTGAMLACHVALGLYAWRRESVLREEPQGLLGAATLLRGSESLQSLLDLAISTYPDEEDKVQTAIEELYDMRRVRCWVKEGVLFVQVDDGAQRSARKSKWSKRLGRRIWRRGKKKLSHSPV